MGTPGGGTCWGGYCQIMEHVPLDPSSGKLEHKFCWSHFVVERVALEPVYMETCYAGTTLRCVIGSPMAQILL